MCFVPIFRGCKNTLFFLIVECFCFFYFLPKKRNLNGFLFLYVLSPFLRLYRSLLRFALFDVSFLCKTAFVLLINLVERLHVLGR